MHLKSGTSIALLGEVSPDYLAAIVAIFSLECTVVFCSIRDPIHVTKIWLKSLNCKYLINFNFEKLMSYTCKYEFYNYNCIIINPYKCYTLFRTSGTSNTPKNVLHKLISHFISAFAVNDVLRFNQEDCWLLSLPIYHISGFSIFIRACIANASIIINIKTKNFLYNIAKYKISHISLVNTQYIMMLQQDKIMNLLSRLKAIILVGGPISNLKLLEAKKKGLNIFWTYGLTETASMVYVKDNWMKNVSYKIMNDGEILIKSPTLFDGYVSSKHINYSKDHDGFFRTGDLGYLDKNKKLKIIGRKDNMIISGGENIYPEEIENKILDLDYIKYAIVVPVKDKTYSNILAAFIKFTAVNNLFFLKKYLIHELPKFKVPRFYFNWPIDVNYYDIKILRYKFIKLADKLVFS
jgi:O-succinylbenzoic acid--CoA ligase